MYKILREIKISNGILRPYDLKSYAKVVTEPDGHKILLVGLIDERYSRRSSKNPNELKPVNQEYDNDVVKLDLGFNVDWIENNDPTRVDWLADVLAHSLREIVLKCENNLKNALKTRMSEIKYFLDIKD